MTTGRYLRKCFGTNQRTGHGVGERHSWPDGWGQGTCRFCGRWLSDLWVVDEPEPPPDGSDAQLAQALRTGA